MSINLGLSNEESFIIDREEKVNGIYFLEVNIDNEGEKIFKLIIE